MTATAAIAQALNSRLATGNHIDRAAKVELRVVISKEGILREMGTTRYIVKGLYRGDCPFSITLKTLVD